MSDIYGLHLKFKGVLAMGDSSELSAEGVMEGKFSITLFAEYANVKEAMAFNLNISQ